MSLSSEQKRLLTPEELEPECSFSKSTQVKMRMANTSSILHSSKIGGKYIRYDRLLIDKWLELNQVQDDSND